MAQPALASLPGRKWAQTHQHTVDAVLGPKVRTVRSMGRNFFNKDNWTARAFAGALCEWARLNPTKTPDRYDVEGWLTNANMMRVPSYEKGITIAATPDELPRGLANALVGGGYHEAWHTEYSRTSPISINEVWPKILSLWTQIPWDPSKGKKGWSGLTGSLLEWSNIIEDIRIERLGCKKYPGSPEKMEALQDLILSYEREGADAAKASHRVLSVNDGLRVVTGAFRDLGLGYQTPAQKLALREYQKNPQAWKFVTQGPLKPLLDRTIKLKREDSLESLWIAMEVLIEISKTATAPPPKPPEAEKKPDAAPKKDPPKPKFINQEAPQQDAHPDEEEAPEGATPIMMKPSKKPDLYKVGERARLTSGPHAGREVEVVRAGLPHPDTGIQDLELALVEPD